MTRVPSPLPSPIGWERVPERPLTPSLSRSERERAPEKPLTPSLSRSERERVPEGRVRVHSLLA